MYNIEDYNYSLPKGLIAQHPVLERDRSRLLRLDRETGCVTHHRFEDILSLLHPSDLLVVNNTRVVPARLIGKKTTGGRVELLILDYPGLVNGAKESDCLVKASKTVKPGTRFIFDGGLEAEVKERSNGTFRVRFFGTADIEQTIEAVGRVPLPPYIKRNDADPASRDRTTYQTVYAREKGAVAAPTAGLHFTPGLLEKIRHRGILVEEITLHVGYGTFFPVKTADIRQHRMHSEFYRISEATAQRITAHKKTGGQGGGGGHHLCSDPGIRHRFLRSRPGRGRQLRSVYPPRIPVSDRRGHDHQFSPPQIHLDHARLGLCRKRSGARGL